MKEYICEICFTDAYQGKTSFKNEQIILLNNRSLLDKTRSNELAVTHASTSPLIHMLI